MSKTKFAAILTVVLASFSSSSLLLAESYLIRESNTDTRSFRITVQIEAKGSLKTPSKEKKPTDLPLQLHASMDYIERRLPPAGRDARAWRSVRIFKQAQSKVVVKDQTTTIQISPQLSQVVAEGDRSGLIFYDSKVLLKRSDLDLLTLPGDPLCLLAALPVQEVELEETWTVPDWAAQMFAGVEAATTTKLTGKLVSVKEDQATLQFLGEVSGATAGAQVQVILNGTAQFDLKQQMLTSFKLTQQEKRSISTVSPGMDITATIQWKRSRALPAEAIPETSLSKIPLDAPPVSKLLQFQSKFWNIRLQHGRNWHLFQELPEVTVMRLVESGSLISQCNIAKIRTARPGEHVPPEQFEKDIRTSLADQLSEIVDAGEVPSQNGNYIFRVIAAGSATDLEMVWNYYLCAHPDGRQVSFVFAVERANLETLNDRDLAIVQSLEFLPAKK